MKKSTLAGVIAVVTASAIGLAAVAPAYAFGEGPGGHGPRGMGPRFEFEALDANSDGQVTQEEIAEHRANMFNANDADGNGVLSAEELIQAAINQAKDGMERRIDRMLERLDQDGDGQLSLEEMAGDPERAARMFSRLDRDGDGVISQEEADQMREARAGRGKQGHGQGFRGPKNQ